MSATMIPVSSSMFASIGYDAANSELLAQYNTGTLAAYGPTTRDEFDAVLGSPSVGVAFNKLIKPVKKYRKVEAGTVIDQVAPRIETVYTPPAAISDPTGYVEDAKPVAVGGYLTPLGPIDTDFAPPTPELAVQQQTSDLATRALSLTIATPAAHVAGQELIIAIGDMKKQVEAFFLPMKTAAHAAHKAVCNRENETLKPLADAGAELGRRIRTFEKQVEADRQAEQERLRIAAQAQAEAEAKAESERLALEDAVELEAAGDTAGAEAVLANPIPVQPRYTPPPVVASPIARVTGAGKFLKEKRWIAVVENINLVPREWMVVDQVALNRFAANRKQLAVVPGVRFEPAE